jgi:hypothetical protein
MDPDLRLAPDPSEMSAFQARIGWPADTRRASHPPPQAASSWVHSSGSPAFLKRSGRPVGNCELFVHASCVTAITDKLRDLC